MANRLDSLDSVAVANLTRQSLTLRLKILLLPKDETTVTVDTAGTAGEVMDTADTVVTVVTAEEDTDTVVIVVTVVTVAGAMGIVVIVDIAVTVAGDMVTVMDMR